jgi:hypothetical protein
MKAYALDDLLPATEISRQENEGKIPISTSSRGGRGRPATISSPRPDASDVVLPWGTALEFMLDSGKADYAPSAAFPELAALRRKEAADEGARHGPVRQRGGRGLVDEPCVFLVLAARPGARRPFPLSSRARAATSSNRLS